MPPVGTTLHLGWLARGPGGIVVAIDQAVGPDAIERLRLGIPHEGEVELRLVGGQSGPPTVLIWDLVAVGLDPAVIGAVETRTVANELPPVHPVPGLEGGVANLVLGLEGTTVVTVTPDMCTGHLGGGHTVLGTPDMIRLMERCAARTVHPHLSLGWATVGVHVDVEHVAPAHVSEELTVASRLIAIRGRRLEWEMTALAEGRLVGRGRHQHHVVRRRS